MGSAAISLISSIKKRITQVLSLLFLFAAFNLSAQTGLSVYVAPVSGQGFESGDNSLFRGRLTEELIERQYSLTGNRNSAAYTLEGTIAAFNESVPQNAGNLFSFRLVLSENNSGAAVAEQTLIYSGRDELLRLLPLALGNLFSGVSGASGDEWHGKTWYLGAAVFWSPRFYYGSSLSAYLVNFGASVTAEFHFLDFLSMEGGAGAFPDWIVSGGGAHRDIVMGIPLSLKLVLKPGEYFMIEPYCGIQYNLSIFGTTKPPPFSWRAGLQYGIKAGHGVFFVESGFSMDFGSSAVKTETGTALEYRRFTINTGIGYKFGF